MTQMCIIALTTLDLHGADGRPRRKRRVIGAAGRRATHKGERKYPVAAQARHIETLENHLHNAGLGYLVEPQYDDQGIPEVSEEALQNVAATIIQSQARRVRTAAMVIRMITERDGYAQGSVGQL